MSTNSIDSIVTDPPYGLKFMNKHWDYDVPTIEFWREALRVLKPGGHVLSFGGTRTYHRMVVNMEDAGFQIRDQVQWLYGSGFPKSLNINKRIEKEYQCQLFDHVKNAELKSELFQVELPEGKTGFVAVNAEIHHEAGRGPKMGIGVVVDLKDQTVISQFVSTESIDLNMILSLKKRLVESSKNGSNAITLMELKMIIDLRIWKLFQYQNTLNCIVVQNHTALKPANEPICLAMKPISEKTIAANMLKWGTGALNIDGSRIGSELIQGGRSGRKSASSMNVSIGEKPEMHQGRWPANLILDEEAAALLDEQSGILKSGDLDRSKIKASNKIYVKKPKDCIGSYEANSGGASRFFYVAKASKRERGEGNGHPTIKPVKLMEYLCRLITSPGGVILDPFMGSGSTGIAAKNLGFDFIGIELNEEYFKIAIERLAVYR